VALLPSHSDLYDIRFVYQNLSQGFTADPPQVAQFSDSEMAFESCALGAHPSSPQVQPAISIVHQLNA
jgi:hypothetical protein